MAEVHQFQTEVQQLLNLVIHSLYSNKDIFLRELVANANDAIDKARFLALTNPEIAQAWEIRLSTNEQAGTLTISDNGIGLDQAEMIEHLGTIAKSGTKAFLEQLKESKESNTPDLIGQFGVGFYSAFMVADKVEVVSRKAGTTTAALWRSQGDSQFEIEPAERNSAGTDVIVYLKEDAKDYLGEWRIREIISKYADFIEHPIRMQVTHKKDDKEEIEDLVLNSQKAIWRRPPAEVKPEEYETFFKHVDHFGGKPLKSIHWSVEGVSSFTALLFIPEKAPYDLLMPDARQHGLNLYVRRVFITDCCKELIPEYLRFVKGTVESNDLPLNVSREILQDNPHIRTIGKAIVRKVLSELQSLLDNRREEYIGFFQQFSRTLKEGLRSDYMNQDKIKDLLLFETLNGEPGKMVTLKEYVAQMPAEQTDIFYFTGESRQQIEASPMIEYAKSKGWDVLLMTDTIDEWIAADLGQYQEKSFKAVNKGNIELTEDEKKNQEKQANELKEVIDFIQEQLKETVEKVNLSTRLTNSPACLTRGEYDVTPHLERFLKAMNQPVPQNKLTLEINPNHPIITKLNEKLKVSKDDPKLADYAFLLLDQATLAEGSPLTDPAQFTRRLSTLMTDYLG